MMRKKNDCVIGIDPDVDGSGVGIVLHQQEVHKMQMILPELVQYLRDLTRRQGPDNPPKIVIEAGWMNNGNYHLQNKGQYHASKIGERVGRNHEISRQIGVFCDYYGIAYEFVPPLVKTWKGKDGKISAEELELLMKGSVKIPCKGRTNQETRDAILLAMTHADIPLIMAPKK